MAALASPALIPSSLCFAASADSPPSLSCNFSAFYDGATNLRYHKSFLSVSSSSPYRNRRGSSRRSVVVFAASGDYYATLGVPKSANSKEIKAAYRRLARQVYLTLILIGLMWIIQVIIWSYMTMELMNWWIMNLISSTIPMWTRNLEQPKSSRKSVLPMRYAPRAKVPSQFSSWLVFLKIWAISSCYLLASMKIHNYKALFCIEDSLLY